jgi:pimeloyl-ACP methyl ester carboxylesterase
MLYVRLGQGSATAGYQLDSRLQIDVASAVMEATTHRVPAEDGAMLVVEEFGEPAGKPVLVHHGSPGSRRLYRPDADLAATRYGLRLLSYDRPGYGGRPRRQGRRVADAIPDVRSIAAARDIGRLGIWGLSGGGCYALACAALLPDLVTGAAVFASFASYGSPGLEFCAGMSAEYAAEVGLFFTDRPAARRNWREDADRLAVTLTTPEGWIARCGEAAGTDDARSREVACHLAAGMRDSLADGDGGWWDDWAAVLTPWGCDLTTTRAPVRLWHGARDRAVPVVHGLWLAAHVPGIVARIMESEDHTNVEHNHRQEAYSWLSGLT